MTWISLPNLTPSRVTALGCRKRFHAEFVAKSLPHEEFSPQMAFGTAMHQALQWLNTPINPVPPADRDIAAIVRRAFLQQPYSDASLQEEEIVRALPMIGNYHRQTVGGDQILGTEIFAQFSLSTSSPRKAVFGAKFDILLARQDKGTVLVIRDYKTGQQRGVNLESACIMIAVAKAKLNEFKRVYGLPFADVVLEYDYISSNGLARRVALGVNNVKELWPDLRDRAQVVYSSTEFPAEPGDYCPRCPLLESCRPDQNVDVEELDMIFA